MSISVALVVLASAVFHASWNLLVKGAGDRLVAAWIQVTTAALLAVPVVVLTGGLPVAAMGWLLLSGCVHCAYVIGLTSAYDRAPLSLVYPVARGTAPLLTLIAGVVFLGDDIAFWTGFGVLVVSSGIAVLATGKAEAAGLAWAVGTGVLIATYTILDAHSVREFGNGAAWAFAVQGVNAVLMIPMMVRRVGGADKLVSTFVGQPRQIVGGTIGVIAYGLVLWAAQRAPVGAVSAVRETSVVLGALGGWLLLGEDFSARRLVGAAIVATGVAFVAGS